MIFLSKEDEADLDQTLATTAFLHGVTHTIDMHMALAVMNSQLRNSERTAFNRIRIDTAANRRSVMGQR